MDIKNNTGVLFKNDKKGNEKAPDYKGKANIDGKMKDIAQWQTLSKGGTYFFSVKFNEEYQKPLIPEPTPDAGVVDDLPF